MRRVAPSVIAGERLVELLAGGADRESNVVSALVETVTGLVVGSRNGYERGRLRTAEGSSTWRSRRSAAPRSRSARR
jgi:hypothetical protein